MTYTITPENPALPWLLLSIGIYAGAGLYAHKCGMSRKQAREFSANAVMVALGAALAAVMLAGLIGG